MDGDKATVWLENKWDNFRVFVCEHAEYFDVPADGLPLAVRAAMSVLGHFSDSVSPKGQLLDAMSLPQALPGFMDALVKSPEEAEKALELTNSILKGDEDLFEGARELERLYLARDVVRWSEVPAEVVHRFLRYVQLFTSVALDTEFS